MKCIRLIILAASVTLSSPSRAEPNIQAGFSSEGSARELVLKTIGDAKHRIQILAYSLQAPDIMQALVDARKRGVTVRVVVDRKRNLVAASKKAMRVVTLNGIELRTNDRFYLHHDKTIIVDGDTVATGSFNFAVSAETANSENVVVIRGAPNVTRQSRWDLGVPYRARAHRQPGKE